MVPLIVIVYYDRPNMVRNALSSFHGQSIYCKLAVIDDGSMVPVAPIVEDVCGSFMSFPDRVKIYRCEDTIEQKIAQGGSRHGELVNQAILESGSDIVVVVCDDDALTYGGVDRLCEFYQSNPSVQYSYSHIITYNPLAGEKWDTRQSASHHWLNRSTSPIVPACNVDGSQVTFRTRCFTEDGVRFPFPQTGALDAEVFQQLTARYGLAPFNGVTLQFKGIYPGQMGNRADSLTPVDSGAK